METPCYLSYCLLNLNSFAGLCETLTSNLPVSFMSPELSIFLRKFLLSYSVPSIIE
jgi:hypothetical protein